ncbi:MAG: thiamine phosphate synthase [Immundisolibacteraceae bacterium]|nr:thiamine phosphate synthase [Immundisolibacteraceae bacterium]
MNNKKIHGLYAIADTSVISEQMLLQRTKAVLQGGARVVQYRDKQNSASQRLQQAQALRQLTAEYQAIFIINDDFHLAVEVGADGVHLGEEDGALVTARNYFRDNNQDQALIGISCYNQLTLALAAEQEGADYVAFGRCYSSTTKPGDRYVTQAELVQARQQLTIPMVAIGGITTTNTPELIDAGVDSVAVIAALFDVEDSRQAAKEFCQLLG